MSEFTWTDSIDRAIDRNGVVFLYGTGSQDCIQKFCEDISHLVGYKCDWSYVGGRFRMKVLPEGLGAVKVALENKEWLQRYVRPFYKQESGCENFESYFEPYIPIKNLLEESSPEEVMMKAEAENDYILKEEEITTTDANGNTVTQVIVHRVGK